MGGFDKEARDESPPGQPDRVERAGDEAELDRLRAEVARLEGQVTALTRRGASGRTLLLVRKVLAAVLVVLAGFGAVASVVGLWGARTTLNTDRWVATVGPLPEHPEFTAAIATYLSEQVFQQLDVESRVARALPPQAAFLAAPVTNAVRDHLRGTVQRFMDTEQFKTLWIRANRFAHANIMAVLEDRSETLSIKNGTITLNLLPIVNDLLVAIEAELPTMFGKRLDLPTLSSGEIPAGLEERIETALGVSLPEDFAQITLYDHDELGVLQDAVVTFKRSVALLVIATLVLLALAVAVSPSRRRTLLQFGLALTVAVVVLSSVLRAVRDQLLAQVPEGVYREGASVALYEVFSLLRERGDQLLALGIGIAVLAYLVGPGRLPVALRRHTIAGLRAAARAARRADTERVRRWIARHVDPLRVGGVVVGAVLALLFASWPALLAIALLLAGYEVLVTVLARSSQTAIS